MVKFIFCPRSYIFVQTWAWSLDFVSGIYFSFEKVKSLSTHVGKQDSVRLDKIAGCD